MPTTLTIHWFGFFFNSTLFASLILLLWIILTKRASYCYVPRFYFMSLCLGFSITILVAWSSALLHKTFSFIPRTYDHYKEPDAYINAVETIEIPPLDEWDRFAGTRNVSFGYYESSAWFGPKVYGNPITRQRDQKCKLGWSAYCLAGQRVANWFKPSHKPAETTLRHISQLMALPVYWPGMLINWIFYSVIIAIPLRGIPRFIKWNRIRKHLCIKCKYPLGELATCPECGKKRG